MRRVKLLGQGLMAVRHCARTNAHKWLTFGRQVAELQARIAVLNRYTALGIPVTEPVA